MEKRSKHCHLRLPFKQSTQTWKSACPTWDPAMTYRRLMFPVIIMLVLGCVLTTSFKARAGDPQEPRSRARDLGIVIGVYPTGPLNAITDVAGVKVGHQTLISGEGPLKPGVGPIRTAVTLLIPPDNVCPN